MVQSILKIRNWSEDNPQWTTEGHTQDFTEEC